MITSKNELKKAIEAGNNHIVVGGQMAQEIIKKKRKANLVKKGIGIACVVGSLAAIPFSGGLSAAGTTLGLAAVGRIGLTITAKELAILCGTLVLGHAINKCYSIHIDKKNETVTLSKN